jgi:prevent-host-death family protein
MPESVGVRELRQNISRYLDRVKEGETFVVNEHGREVAHLVPSTAARYARAAALLGATVPTGRLPDVARKLLPLLPPHPDGTADAILAESREDDEYS